MCFVEYGELYGRVSAVWNIVGSVEGFGLCGIVWAMWIRVRYKN